MPTGHSATSLLTILIICVASVFLFIAFKTKAFIAWVSKQGNGYQNQFLTCVISLVLKDRVCILESLLVLLMVVELLQ